MILLGILVMYLVHRLQILLHGTELVNITESCLIPHIMTENMNWFGDLMEPFLALCGTNHSIQCNDNRECGQGQITRTIVPEVPMASA